MCQADFVLASVIDCKHQLSVVINKYSLNGTWYVTKRINHYCSVVPEKSPSQPLGQQLRGKLGKPRFLLEWWALGLGLGFFCPN